MPIIPHKFRNHIVSPETEILILGTFNPDVPNGPTFFYGRPRNYLWRLLPGCWALPSLKNGTLQDKQGFMAEYKIDFADVIHSVLVPEDQVNNLLDTYIDDKVQERKEIITLISSLKKLKAIYFTRKTFTDIPNIHAMILAIQNYCRQNAIRFCLLETPARFTNDEKQQMWINTINIQHNCCQV